MEFLFNIILILFIFISSNSCQNLTYILSPINTTYINSLLQLNGLIITNTSYVKRLSTASTDLITTTQTLSTATNVQSIIFISNTGDCSYPYALAASYSTKYISSPICFTRISSLNNFLQLSVTSDQLAQAAISFLTQYSLHYFTIICSNTNDFHMNLAQQFSSYLTQKNYILERTISVSNFTSSSTITSLNSRG